MAHHSSQEQAVRFFTGRPHVGVPHGPLRVLAAWRGDAIRARGDYRYHLSRAELGEIEAGLAHAMATGKPTIDLGARDLPLPTLAEHIGRWRDELREGLGFVVISGVPVHRWSPEESERFFWAFGQHLGIPGCRTRKATCSATSSTPAMPRRIRWCACIGQPPTSTITATAPISSACSV